MKKAFIYPGQGAQFPGMGSDLYYNNSIAKEYFERANLILEYNITKTMFEGTANELKQTKITQPAVFLHSIILSYIYNDFNPTMVAGHSLGEFSALVASKALSFDDGLKLVYKRALAMQKACETNPSTMAAILGLNDEIVEECCDQTDGIVVAANYNCLGQLVISGTHKAVATACEKMKEAGAKRTILLPVGGAFHSPLMESAQIELEEAINETIFSQPICPIYQNVTAKPSTDIIEIKNNLIKQLTSPVRWTEIIQNMATDGASQFIESGPGNVLQGLVKKICKGATVGKL